MSESALSEEEAQFIEDNPDVPEVKSFKNFLSIQMGSTDPMGMAMLSESLRKLRKVILSSQVNKEVDK